MEVSGQLQASAALTPGKNPPMFIVHEAGWAQVSFVNLETPSKYTSTKLNLLL
jgi:hypothetical protein